MINEAEKDQQDQQNKNAAVKPEPETLHTTDPQDNMEGPVSSLLQKGKHGFENDKPKEEADEEKDKNK